MKEVLCVREAQREWEECLWWMCLHVSLCVFLAGCVLGFHYTRTLPPGAFSPFLPLLLSLSLWFCENTLGIRWAETLRRKRKGGLR